MVLILHIFPKQFHLDFSDPDDIGGDRSGGSDFTTVQHTSVQVLSNYVVTDKLGMNLSHPLLMVK